MKEKSVSLSPISKEDFHVYLQKQITEYAEEKIKAGSWDKEEAYLLSKKSFRELLPDGKNTSDHSIMVITDTLSAEKIGVIWVEWNNQNYKSTYLWDIIIYDKFRRMGYGSRAMNILESMVKDHGMSSLVLHVFGHNKNAISMYYRLGYHAVDIIMEKNLKGNI
ncbi:GNAT family N-acetyltransferase [Ferroplasma sp.]|uniref:GNAT family N-acetyltransferase n=1 Tax=Ferroplasma sp. TaxID=2591003 RepID=UPI00307F9DEB